MILTYLGHSFVKAQQGDLVVAFNPPKKEAEAGVARFGADLALISLKQPLYNGKETVAYANKDPFVIEGPGEYEIGGIFIEGFPSEGADGRINTVYTISLDGIRICHLGALAIPNLSAEVIEKIGVVEILFTPIGGEKFLTPKDASKLATSFEPKIVIPLEYENDEKNLKLFLKEMGAGEVKKIDKLTVKRKDLEGKEGEVVILSS